MRVPTTTSFEVPTTAASLDERVFAFQDANRRHPAAPAVQGRRSQHSSVDDAVVAAEAMLSMSCSFSSVVEVADEGGPVWMAVDITGSHVLARFCKAHGLRFREVAVRATAKWLPGRVVNEGEVVDGGGLRLGWCASAAARCGVVPPPPVLSFRVATI